MKTSRTRNMLGIVLALVVGGLVLSLGTEVHAQWVTSWPTAPVVYGGTVQYQRIYQGPYWHWTANLGWHTHDHYLDVPYWPPVYWPPAYYFDSRPWYVPVIAY